MRNWYKTFGLWLRRFIRKDINIFLSPVHLRHIRRYQFAREVISAGSVLDIACGAGYGSKLLSPYSTYTGVDYADYCIAYAKKHYSGPNINFLQANLFEYLPGLGNHEKFDAVISFETLEHLDAPLDALILYLDALVYKGILVVSIPLNHPDLIYHKRQYSYSDVQNLIGQLQETRTFHIENYFQHDLSIWRDTDSSLEGDTWIGVLMKMDKP